VPIVFRYRDYVMELPYRALFVAQHLLKFHLIQKLFDRIALSHGVPAPNFTLYVVLKENCGNCEATWKINRRVEKITDGNIEVLFLEASVQLFLNRNRLKSTDRIGNRRGHPDEIVQATPDRIESAFSRTEANGSRKLPREFCLVCGIALSVVIGQKDEFVDRGQSSKDLVRADIPAAVCRENLVRLDPENSQPALLKRAPRRIPIILWVLTDPCRFASGNKVGKRHNSRSIEHNESEHRISHAGQWAFLHLRDR
jgi:hypothetical protein